MDFKDEKETKKLRTEEIAAIQFSACCEHVYASFSSRAEEAIGIH